MLKRLWLLAIIFILLGIILGVLALSGIIIAVPITSKLLLLFSLISFIVSGILIIMEKYILKGKDIPAKIK